MEYKFQARILKYSTKWQDKTSSHIPSHYNPSSYAATFARVCDLIINFSALRPNLTLPTLYNMYCGQYGLMCGRYDANIQFIEKYLTSTDN